jgi:hypothetical protein
LVLVGTQANVNIFSEDIYCSEAGQGCPAAFKADEESK